ncbi:MAG: hypothetical protein NVSMB63_08230 [Sediminibacterium sp.]
MEPGLAQARTFSKPQTDHLCSYLLVAYPDADARALIAAEKAWLTAKYQTAGSVDTGAAITLACFLAREDMEETIIRWMHRIISNQKSFSVKLHQYSGSQAQGIYLRVEDLQPFQQLARELKIVDQYVQGNGCPDMKISTNPHLPLAVDFAEKAYSDIMTDYALRSFQATFELTELVLLRRQHRFDHCKQVNVFGLQPA